MSVGYQGSVVAGMRAIPFSKRPAIRLSVWTKKMVAKLNRLLKTLGGYNSAQVNILCFVSWALLVCELSMLHIHKSFYIFVFLFQKILTNQFGCILSPV